MDQGLGSIKQKSYTKIFLICLNVSLSAFFVGYSLVYVGMLKKIDFQKAIIKDYGFDKWLWKQQSYKSIIQGTLPIGAILGALLSSQVIRLLSRLYMILQFRKGFLFTNLVLIITTILLIFVENAYLFLIMRIVQGICTGIFSAIVPLYINETITQTTSNLGSLNQILISFGQFFCCAFSSVLDASMEQNEKDLTLKWGIIAGFPIIIIIIQCIIFMMVFPYQTVKYLFQKQQLVDAKYLVNQLYSQYHAEEIVDVFSSKYSDKKSKLLKTKSLNSQLNKFFVTSKMAIFFAIHLALLQQMSGINAIAVYGKNTIQEALSGNTSSLTWATLGLYALPVIASIITVQLMKKIGRKIFIQIGTGVCAVCLIMVAISFVVKGDKGYSNSEIESIFVIIGMCIFMCSFGFSLGPIVWLYIPQIAEANIIPFSTMTNLCGAALCIIIFPLIHSNKFIPFFFFFFWCVISLIINHRLMVETKDKKRQDVFQEFESQKLI